MQGVSTAQTNMHHAGKSCKQRSHGINWLDLPNLIQVLPEFHFSRVRTELVQVAAKKQLPVEDLWAVLGWDFIERTFEAGTSSLESASCNIILKQLFIYDVDDGWNEGFDVFGIGHESADIPCKLRSVLSFFRQFGREL